jgi:hypothetical protein
VEYSLLGDMGVVSGMYVVSSVWGGGGGGEFLTTAKPPGRRIRDFGGEAARGRALFGRGMLWSTDFLRNLRDLVDGKNIEKRRSSSLGMPVCFGGGVERFLARSL